VNGRHTETRNVHDNSCTLLYHAWVTTNLERYQAANQAIDRAEHDMAAAIEIRNNTLWAMYFEDKWPHRLIAEKVDLPPSTVRDILLLHPGYRAEAKARQGGRGLRRRPRPFVPSSPQL
jgi:hypothetical protein